ncbi:hypothetical protein JD844_021055 [Phrynosoma platyrhinos]|uniref:SH3 domain-containing protein n=1 Tax=Phrynosoma platyrhinos TaxID=52577 RepID=A0ABQ7ST75_PHRPL|nr:hypothetical protein JD844_021055 [Phrynosoma platyrhinos]
MSRVLTIKDYRGPDCRYLNFKAGEEIMVYFKLSRKREDLWAGSKGTDFGYFPMDAVQTEEVFITKEVEVPTKETDFLCLDGKDYVFENEGSILNHDEGNEYLYLHTDVFPKEYKEPFPDIEEFDSKSKELYILEATSHDDSELRDSKTGQVETIQQENQNSQTLKHLPSQSSWTISGFADWFSLERKENEEVAEKIADTANEVTFRHRKTTIMDDSDLKTLNEEGDIEPSTSSWFKSTFTGLLHYGSEKSGLGLLYKENDPEILDSSTTDGTVEHDTIALSEEGHSNSGQSKSKWFNIELSDVLTFGYSEGNKVMEKPTSGEESDQNEESPPSSTQTSLIHEDLRKPTVEMVNSEEQEKYDETIKQVVVSPLQKEQEKYDQEAPERSISKANKHIDLDAAASSFFTEVLDKNVKLYAEQDSESRNQVMENINVKAVMKESDRTNDQSGWYESLYSSIVNVKRVTAENQPGHKSVGIKSTQESAADQLQGLDPIYIQNSREKKHEDPPKHQPFLSISYFTNVLNFQGLVSKENINVPDVEKELKSSKESTESKNNGEIVHIDKESKLVLNHNIIENVSENNHVDTSQEKNVASSSVAKSKEENRKKSEDGKLGECKTHLSVKSELEHRFSNGQCIQIHWNCTSENLEKQNNSNTKDKNIGHIWEVEQASSLEVENLISSPGIYCSERAMLMKGEQCRGEAVQHINEYIQNSRLEDTEMDLHKKSNGMDDEVESSLVTHKNTFFRELKEQSDNFPQSRDIPGEDKILLDVSSEDKLLLDGEKEQILPEKPTEMGSKVKEVSREPDSKSSYIDCNEHASADQTNKKAQEEGASQNDWNVVQFPFSSHSSHDTDFSDPTYSEEKPNQLAQLQPFLSLSHYKLLLGFQSFTDKSKNYLQEVQEEKSSKNENSQIKSSVEILVGNKEIEEKNQLYQKMKGETNMKVDFSNQDILLPSSATQDNGDSANVIEEAQLSTDTSSAPSEKCLLDHTMESLFKNQNLKDKDTEDKECNIKGNNQSFSGEQQDAPELKFNVQRSSQQYKIMKRDLISSNPNYNYNKWLVNLQKDYVTGSYENRELVEMKSIESISSDAINNAFPLCLNDYKSVIAREEMNNFSQEKAKGKICISEHLTENDEGKEDTGNGSNKTANEEDSNILNQQGLSTEATSQRVFQSEKEIDGLASHTVSYNSANVKKKNVQEPQMQADEKSSEEKHGSMTDKYVDNGQHSDSSLTKVVYDHGPQAQMTSSPSSGTFSKESMHSLHETIEEDANKPKNEQAVTSSYLTPQDGEGSNIIGLAPDEKCINQVICDTKIHLTPDKEVEKLKIFGQHRQIDGILHNEASKSEHQKEILDIMPKLPGVTSQKKNEDILLTIDNDSLLQKHSVAESISRENPPLNLEVQSETFETDNNVNPSKLFSHDIPHYFEAVDYKNNHMPPCTKDNLNIHHLASDLDDETLAIEIITLLPKNLKCVEKQGYSEHVRDTQGKVQKVIKNDKETEQSVRSEKPRRQGVVSNIFGKTSWLFGDLFQNKPKDITKNNDDGNIIVTQTKTDRQEADEVGSDFDQGKSNVQSTKAIHYSHNVNIIEQESKGKIYSHTMEKSITGTKDLKNDNQKDGILVTEETEAVSHEAVENDKWITDAELDLKEASFFMGFQETYVKLVAESKRILQANLCERHELESLTQESEKLYHNITTFPCENIYSNQRQLTTSQEDEHKLNTVNEKCLKTKNNFLRELQSLALDIKNNCASKRAKSGILSKEQLPGNSPEESNYLNSDKEPNNSQHSETNNIPPANNEEKMHASIKNGGLHPDFKEKLPGELRMTQNTLISNVMTTASKKVVGALPENMRPGPDLYGFPWEIVICGAVLAIFAILLLVCRSYQSVRSRLYVGREKQLASKVAELVEDKCKILEKFSLCKKEKTYEELSSSNSVLKNEIALLEKELREEKSKRSEQDDLIVEIQRRVESLENEAKSIQSQIAEAKTTLKVYEINRERLKISVQDALEENKHLQESEKQLLQEAEGWGERFSELNEQTKMFQCSKADMEEALKNKESQVKSLTECLLKMKDWSSAIGQHDAAEDSHWENDIKCERENGEHLDDQEKRTIKKLIYAAKLNACLKSMETERNQIYSKLTDENKAKEELAERIESLKNEHGVLQSENAHFENEVQKLQQKLKVMSELYQENEMNLHRKLTVEEKERLQKEEKLSKVDEKIIHAAEELNIYRQQAKDLEEELERTVRSYQNQIMSHEKKAHDNWLTARAAERHLNDLRKENLHNRQNVIIQSLYEIWVHGSRGPGNAGTYDIGNERGEMNSDRLSDPHRPPSDTGSLSPPWDRDHRINPSHAGQLYNEQSLPPRRSERFYSNHPNSGRLSGPAELRSYNIQSFDKADGQAAENNSRMDMSGDGIKDHLNDSNAVNLTDQSLAPENETLGHGIVPPPLPLLRPPLIPMDPRGAFIRRGPPFPPVPPSAAYGPREYFPRDFAGLPRPLLPSVYLD